MKKASRPKGFGFDSLKYCHQNHAENKHSDTDILRDCQAVKFKGIVITQKFNKKTGDAIKYEHQSKRTAGFGEKSVGILGQFGLLRPSPEKIEYQT